MTVNAKLYYKGDAVKYPYLPSIEQSQGHVRRRVSPGFPVVNELFLDLWPSLLVCCRRSVSRLLLGRFCYHAK